MARFAPSSGPPQPTDALGRTDLAPLWSLLALVKPYRWRFWLATIALFVSSGLGLVYPQAARQAVDIGLAAPTLDRLNWLVLFLIAVFLVQAVFIWIRHFLMSWLGERVVADLRVQVFDKLLTLPPSWFHVRHTGEILSRLSSDVTVVDHLVGSELSLALRHSLTLFGGIVLLFVENPKLTLLMLAIVPPVVVGVVFFGRRVRRLSRAIQDRHAVTSTRVEEVVSAMQTVQAFVREQREAQTYRANIGAAFDQSLQLVRWRATFFASTTLAVSLAIAAVVWVGGGAVVSKELSGGDLTAFLLYTAMVAASVGALASLGGTIQRAAGATERIFDILRTQPDIADAPDAVPLPVTRNVDGRNLQGAVVAFEDVEFAYPTRSDHPVLRGISLRVEAGRSVALVGASGSGKTTLTALLQRFQDVQGGRVTFDGVDVRRLKVAELRRAIAIVSQEPVLFSGTIRDNIAFARPDAAEADIVSAARDAHAIEFIDRFPDGWATLIGERGVQLSGGQRQRIAIARAVLANPRVLILDEATSSLDAESEALVQQALARLMVGRTTIVIAHRLSTVRDAHQIAVLERGRLVDQGTHDSLMDHDGTYRRLVEHQVFATDPVPDGVAAAPAALA